MSKQKLKPKKYKPDIDLARATLEIAQHNLDASMDLYQKAHYPESIFFLQQSIEKACKSYGFYSGLINEDDVRSNEVGHKSAMVFNKLMKAIRKMIINNKERWTNIYENYNFDKDQIKSNLIIENNADEFINQIEKKILSDTQNSMNSELTINDISELLEKSEICVSVCEEKEKTAYSIQKLVSFTMGFNNITEKLIRVKLRGIEQIEEIVDEPKITDVDLAIAKMYIYNTYTGIGTITPLLELAMITQPHESSTRYVINGHSPYSLYTIDHPIVQSFDRIYTISKKIFFRLNDQFEKYPM